MNNGYEKRDHEKAVHYFQVIDFIKLMKSKILKKSKYSIKLIQRLIIQLKEK